MFRTLITLIVFFLGLPSVLRAEFRYLRLEIYSPSNAQLTEGPLALNGSFPEVASLGADFAEPPPPTTLYGWIDHQAYRNFGGNVVPLPSAFTGDFLLVAAKDGTFAAHSRLGFVSENVIAPVATAILVNSRERMSFDFEADLFYYGTKALGFSRDRPFHIDFQYGGSFDYIDANHFRILSASNVRTEGSIVTVPEPSCGVLVFTTSLLPLLGRRRHIAAAI